ncbi:MAG: methanogenesis marker protein Mmp4/MtxX, partial [Halobacteriota archaeon]
MNIVRKRSLSNTAKVAIGVRDPTSKMISSIEKAQNEGYAHVILVGDKQEIDAIGTSLEIIN